MESLPSFRAALRQVMQRVPRVRPLAQGSLPLERMPGDAEPPRLIDAQVVEDATVRARRVPGDAEPGFAAFLDGSQHSEVVAWHGPAPIVIGVVGAVIRSRVDRRLVTWGSPRLETRLYVPFAYTQRVEWEEAFPRGSLIDTTRSAADGAIPPAHPTLLLERAKQAVQHDREVAERELAHAWCARENRPLFVDGSISASEVLAASECSVGVVKSHRTLYVDAEALGIVLSLGRGERSSVVRIASRGRSSVLSWYLRLRDYAAHDALWGLVRVEVAESARITERADEVSRWVLAETVPTAMPDPRWDRMTYPILNCEEYLRSRIPSRAVAGGRELPSNAS
ncbi:MAG: hypothetical protein ACREON_01655 [Gemmatimonadaceae bacterium]